MVETSFTQGKMQDTGNWFNRVFGFKEKSDMQETKDQIEVEQTSDGMIMKSKVTGAAYNVGTWSTPSLEELRQQAI